MTQEPQISQNVSGPRYLFQWLVPNHRGIGMVAWLLQRLSGLLLVAYLFMHLVVLFSLTFGETRYNDSISMISGGIWILFDAALILVILFHGLNGIRVLLFDLGFGTTKRGQKVIFWLLMAIGALLFPYLFYLLTQIELVTV